MLVGTFCSVSYNRFPGLHANKEHFSLTVLFYKFGFPNHLILSTFETDLFAYKITVHLAQDFHSWLLVSALCSVMNLCSSISIHYSKMMNDIEDVFI